MNFYKLSQQRVKRVINSPQRKEVGIAENTVALMQRAGSKKHPYEIWTMIQQKRQTKNDKEKTIRIISAWRYPGITKSGEGLPEEVLKEINEIIRIA